MCGKCWFWMMCLIWTWITMSPFTAVSQQADLKPVRPNILFMLTDDQRYDDLGCMGNSLIQTPNLDRLAADGVLFENAFVTTAICCSSRASILTGQHMRRHGIRDFKTPLSAEQMDATYPVLLRRAGYRTGFLGKFAIGSPVAELRHLALPADKFDFWFGFPQSISFRQVVGGQVWHLTPLLAEKAIEFLETNPPGQPFCLSISFKSPHGPWSYFDPDLPNPYEKVELPLPATYSRQDFMAQPEFLRRSLNGNRDGKWYDHPRERFENTARTCYRLITGVDIAVGRIMSALRRRELDQNTIVIFTSDHGSLRGEHGLFGKWIMYESSIRIPLVIRDPRLPRARRGSRRRQMVLNIDLAPTMLAMAGVAAPAAMQGRDLQPLLRNEQLPWRKDWYYEHVYNTRPPRAPIVKTEGLRTERWKYIRYPEQQPVYEQLFDLQHDPLERRNLAADPHYAGQLDTLRKRCAQRARQAR